MIKSIIKEIFIMLFICVAIILVFGIVFYDYIPINKVIPSKVSYVVPEDIKGQLEDTVIAEQDKVILTYQIDSTDLNRYKNSGSYVPGKANPFEAYVDPNSIPANETEGGTTGENPTNTSGNGTGGGYFNTSGK